MKILHQAVNLFKLDTGRYPTAEESLTALVLEPADVQNWQSGGYLVEMEVPMDGWGNPFIYLCNPNSRTPFIIISYGADGKEGGHGYNTDLYSTDPF
ncbi:MAG: type II secretion system protein GspG [Sedimentisphaerales bacterium]|nr:type II secretion system protein GspG [Sedimentisphaerales bacterium]